MSPPNSCSRLIAHGDMMPVRYRRGMPYSSCRICAVALGREQAERRLVDRRSLERVDRMQLHHGLEALGDRRLAAADGAQQVEDLLLLLETLRGMLEERDDLLDRVFHAVELARTPGSAGSPGCRRGGRGADRCGCRRARVRRCRQACAPRLWRTPRVALAQIEVLVERQLFFLRRRVIGPERIEQLTHRISFASRRSVPGTALFRCRAGNARTLAAWSLIHYITHLVFRKARANILLALSRHRVLKCRTLRRPCRRIIRGTPTTLPSKDPSRVLQASWKGLRALLLSTTQLLGNLCRECHDGFVDWPDTCSHVADSN